MNILIEELTEEQAKKLLQRLIDELDELDEEDYFGSNGWKYFFGFND